MPAPRSSETQREAEDSTCQWQVKGLLPSVSGGSLLNVGDGDAAARSLPIRFSPTASHPLHDGTAIKTFSRTYFVVCHIYFSGKQNHFGENFDALCTSLHLARSLLRYPSTVSIFKVPECWIQSSCCTPVQLESEKWTLFSKCWMGFVCHAAIKLGKEISWKWSRL